MFSKLICSGCSFTSGYGLTDSKKSWPYLLGKKLNLPVENLAREGMGNEYIFNSIIDADIKNGLVVVCLTDYNRVEFIYTRNKKTFTSIPNGIFHQDFLNLFFKDFYDEEYYFERFERNLKLFETFMNYHNVKYFMFDSWEKNKKIKNPSKNYLWHGKKTMVDFTYPHKLPDGHPNETAHEIMAEKLFKIILDKIG